MKPESNTKRRGTFTDHLKALLVGGAVALGASQTGQAASLPTDQRSVDARIAKVLEQLRQQPGNQVSEGSDLDGGQVNPMWWRNFWPNGGGWHNWHNGGFRPFRPFGPHWGNWHNW